MQAGLWILAVLTVPTFCQETQEGSKARFDKILEQFGFSRQAQGGWQETKGRTNFVAEIAGAKVELQDVSAKVEPQGGPGEDLLQILQEGALDKTRAIERQLGDKKEIKRLTKEDALAKLFSVAKDKTHSYKLKSKEKKKEKEKKKKKENKNKKEKKKKVNSNLPKLKVSKTNKDSEVGKSQQERLSKDIEAGGVIDGNVHNITLGAGGSTKADTLEEEPAIPKQKPTGKATPSKGSPNRKQLIVFIPPTEKPDDKVKARTKNKSINRRKFGSKVKNDLKTDRIFIAPTIPPQTLEKRLKEPADEIFDNYISDLSSFSRNLKERNSQDALAKLFSVAKGKGGENPKRKKMLKKMRTKNTSSSQSPLLTQSLKRDPLFDLFSVSPPTGSLKIRGRQKSAKSGNLKNGVPSPQPASHIKPSSPRSTPSRPVQSSRRSSSPRARVPTTAQLSLSSSLPVFQSSSLSDLSRLSSPSPSSRLSVSPRPSSPSPSSRPPTPLRLSSTSRPKHPTRSFSRPSPTSTISPSKPSPKSASDSRRVAPPRRPAPSPTPQVSAKSLNALAALFKVAKVDSKGNFQKLGKASSPSKRLPSKARGTPTERFKQNNAKYRQTPLENLETMSLVSARVANLPRSISVRQRGSPTPGSPISPGVRQRPGDISSPRPRLGVRAVAKGRPLKTLPDSVRALDIGVSSRPAAVVESTQPARRGSGVPRPPRPTLTVARGRGSPAPLASIRPSGSGQGVLEQLLSIAGDPGKNPVQILPPSSSIISGANSVRISEANSRGLRPPLKVQSRVGGQLPRREGENVAKPEKETPRASLASDRPKISGASLLASVNQVPRAFSKARAQIAFKPVPQISTSPETFTKEGQQVIQWNCIDYNDYFQASLVTDATRAGATPRPRGPDLIRSAGQARSRGIGVNSKFNNGVTSSKRKEKNIFEEDAVIFQKPSVYGCRHLCGTMIYDVYKLLGGKVCDC